MSRSSFLLGEQLADYVRRCTEPPDAVAAEVARRTGELPNAVMQLGHEAAVLLGLLTRLTRARLAVEVGTFTGYSSLAIARGLAPGGRLLCFDSNSEWTRAAREAWRAAGVEDRVTLTIGPALDGLRALPARPEVDLAFVDADKTGYPDYFREIVPRLRPGGVLLVDNVLQGGRVADPAADDDSVRAVRAYNEMAVRDDRVDVVLLTVGDGLSLVVKR